ncbi:GGDEF domain-containing protein [Pseudoalteromonas sp. MMG024]|uniref:GGDEF domain-containing protein n=1 Tax=Pseudoalteromonas sp. MMG024 TaxID=2909980 RepID=UPI001F3108AD|nr:GGDEF domain-containing protein [Pseudoalteromonas sp. MMG024]MCF6456954.1 GGDEF domain-containing protein [Pseudoalteromonas sp. MMG024]
MSVYILALFILLPFVSYWLFPAVANVDVISFASEFIMASAVLVCIFNLNNFRQSERSNNMLFTGFSILLVAICVDALDELVIFPKVITIVIEDLFQIIGLLLIVFGIKLWLEKQEAQSNTLLKLATTDPLTGAYTRRYFIDKANEIMQSYNPRFCILILDIDHFKKINDQYGHNVGDLALVEFCNLIQSNCRESDLFARWGGEEFIILLPHIATPSAYNKAESLRVQLENTELHLSNVVFNMTISIGIAEYSTDMKKLETLIDIADKRLYQAKQQGRNQVVSGTD